MRKKAIIIGAGLAGTVLANRLAESMDVLLLEKGPERGWYTPDIRYDGRALAAVPTFCLGGGGTTNLWHNGLVPLRDSDLAPGSFRSVLEDSARFRDTAASLLHFPDGEFSALHARVVRDIGAAAEALGWDPDAADSLLYPKRYAPLRPHGDVATEYEVQSIEFVREGDRIEAVEYRVDAGTRRARADVVVVAAGALGTPGIVTRLLERFDGPTDTVGRGLIDHPMGFVGKVRFRRGFADAARRLEASDHGSFSSRSPLRLHCRGYTACVFLRPSVTTQNRLAIHKYKSLLGASQGWRRVRNAFDPRLLHPDILAEISSHLLGLRAPGRTYSLLFIGEQKRGDGRAYFDGDQLVVDWRISEEEVSIYREMLTDLRERLAPSAEVVHIHPEITDAWLWSCAHHSGTTSMGSAGVIDTDLRVRSTKNAFVCDASVIQEHSYANTGLTIGQLALRLADHLLTEEVSVVPT